MSVRTFTTLSLALACLLAASAPVLANGYDVYAPPLSWSPDGRLLAAAVNASWPRDDTLADGALRLYGRNGEVLAELAQGNCGTPSFSPDGRHLAAVVNGSIAIFEVPSGEPWTGFAPAADSPALSGTVLDCVWLADSQRGSTLWYTAGERFYGCKCYTLDPATGAGSEAWADSGDGSVLAPQPSPDGRFLTALAQSSPLLPQAAYERLVVWPRDGQPKQAARHQVRPDDYHESNAVFIGPHTLIFQRGGWGDWRLVRLDLATGREYIELADAQHPALDGSGELLAYARRDFAAKQAAESDWDVPSEVRLRERSTRADWLASTPGVYAELPALSPDGVRLAWLELAPDGAARVAIRTVAGLREHGSGARPVAKPLAPVSEGEMPRVVNYLLAKAPGDMKRVETAPLPAEPVQVVLETTAGDIVLAVHPEWAPLGAARFLELVDSGFYDGAPWFRVIDGFVAQCGIAADPAVNALWEGKTIKDDPVTRGNRRGTVAFGKTGQPDSRSTHIFINYKDNSRSLDPQGFAAFAEVTAGMDVADKLFRAEYDDQGTLAAPGGLAMFRQSYPEADYILSARRGGEVEAAMSAPAATSRVVLETTKGDIVLEVHLEWAPIGAVHFLELVKLGFYDGAPWFRVIDRVDPTRPDAPPVPFVAQCGIAADPALNEQWGEANIQDDPVVMGNTRGRVAYGKTDEPHSRSTHIYINFGDNSRLDARGFAAFAEVVAGLEIADSLFKCEYEDQDELAAEGGLAEFRAKFPEADYIIKAYVEGS